MTKKSFRDMNVSSLETLTGAMTSFRCYITHLLFADDNILFGEAAKECAKVLKGVLMEYESISAQCVNFDKSTKYNRSG